MVAGVTDWADGKLASWLDQYSRLGALLDPAADRLYIVARWSPSRCATSCRCWVVALLVGRELVLGVALLVLRRYGYPPLQVHYLGKAATLLLLYAFPALLLAHGEGWLADVRRAVRLGVHDLGYGAVPAGRAALRRPGGRDRARRAGRPAGTAP